MFATEPLFRQWETDDSSTGHPQLYTELVQT
jgi:hypothetical protein